MTTDITELAQRTDLLMDNALETAKQLHELSESTVADAIFESIVENENGKEIQFERPISDLAYAAFLQLERLVEALEKAQRVDEELCKLLPPGVEYMDPPDGGDVTPLEGVRRMVADYRQRIAELESRTVTVKLPGWFVKDAIAVYDRDEIEEALTAAGIKVEAE
ncbi:hypothetical protein [Raoultella ornithinolytica]|uniref:hypothetical protein n=1 Tax=Raoultella ornithinolytica TaxID=54291 RepID=UPI00096A49DA|nr:hypothetical protein [Raoultella ornithinolytica]